MLDKAIPRHDYPIFADGKQAGKVTSGTFSPSLSIPVGLGYVELPCSGIDTRLEIKIREQLHPAVVVKAPFL
jgi:aminomethyltransferase